MPRPESPTPIILVISGPAGSGKTTLCERLLAAFPDRLQRIITTTSRRPRHNEQDGVDYHFLSSGEFEKRLEEGAFIEYAKVHGRFYGSQKAHVMHLLEDGRDLLLNIDVQGAQAFQRDPAINAVVSNRLHTVFIRPESTEQIRQRMLGRGTDDEAEIQRRLDSAAREIQQAPAFDHIIVSGSREADFTALRALYLSLRK